jgi:thioredoxin reductase (NADPH)
MTPTATDTVIVGAGPAGLFQVFQLGLQEIHAHVIDSLPHAGGQCTALYPDKPIYDIPALPVCTGRELTARLLEQIKPFKPSFHLDQEVIQVEKLANGHFEVTTSAGQIFLTKTLFIAGGVGSFQARELQVEGIAQFRGTQLHYGAHATTAQQLVIVGGEAAALDYAITQCEKGAATSITLLHRRDHFQAPPATLERIAQLRQSQRLQISIGQITGFEQSLDRLTTLHITDTQGDTQRLPLDTLHAFLGLSPKLGAIAKWGLNLDKKQVQVDTEKFQTNIPGIFAVGDINTYPGKKRLITCAFHEATLAAFACASYIQPGLGAPLQYTTTSKKLHRLLGLTAQP